MNTHTDEVWPSLPFAEWKETCATLHMWTQIVGKIRLALAPWTNHSWHVPLYVTARGLTTSPIPHGARIFEIDVDCIDHRLIIASSEGKSGGVSQAPQSVAAFHRRLMDELERLDLHVDIYAKPNEVATVI